MVLARHLKKYKHLMRTMLTQLVEHENITTTRAKAKHLRTHAQKLLTLAKKAQAGKTSPLNLLKGRIHTKKAQTKLLVDLIPRIKNTKGGFINLKNLSQRRKGDNAPMVEISIKGNQKTQFEKRRKQQALAKGEQENLPAFKTRILIQEKQHLEKLMHENPQKAAFFKAKIDEIQFRQWVVGKSLKQPPKYTLLI